VSRLRRFFPRTYFAWRNLSRSRIRSVLAVLTIAVGVLAVSGLGIVGLVFEASQQQTLGDIANQVEVVPPTEQFDVRLGYQTGEISGNVPALTDRRLRTIETVAGNASVTALRDAPPPNTTAPRRSASPLSALGATNLEATYSVVRGSIPEDWTSGAVVDTQTSNIRGIEIGDPVTVEGRLQTVIAVVESKGSSEFGSVGLTSNQVLLPMELVDPPERSDSGRQFGAPYTGVVITADDAVRASSIAQQLRARLNDGLPENKRFEVEYQAESAASIDRQFQLTGQFLVAVGGVSVLIAGIGITNVQLMSARERRTEIGVLRAVGFGQVDILLIMLIEAVIMGALAAVAGIAASLAAGAIISNVLLGAPLAFQPGTGRFLLLGAGFGVGVCLLAGVYPAWTASRERPVDALGL